MSGGLFVVLLAAGGARRFGGGKLDAALAGKPLGRHALDVALALGRAAIVIGDPPPFFAFASQEELLYNPRAAEGLGTSVALAARHAAERGAERLLLLAADMPLIRPETLAALAAAPGTAAVRHEDGRPGIPACFPRTAFAALAELGGDQGAGALLRRAGDLTTIATAPGELRDVDTAEDLARLNAALGR